MKIVWCIFVVFVFSAFFESCLCRRVRKIKKLNYKKSIEQKEILIKIILHYDKALTKKLSAEGKNETKRQYITKLSKKTVLEAQDMLRNITNNYKITLELLASRCLSEKSPATMTENILKYLQSYCPWQSKKKETQGYFSALFSGINLVYVNADGKKISRSTGRGYLAGMCSKKHSCAVIEWHPKNAGFLLAHEIGHSLGMSHDGSPDNNCNPKGSVMATKYDTSNHPTKWSTCSQRALEEYLRSEKAWCLRDPVYTKERKSSSYRNKYKIV